MRASLPRNLSSAALLIAVLASACSSSEAQNVAPVRTTTTSTSTTSTSTTLPPTTTTAKPPPPPGLTRGSKGPEVQAMEQRLADLKYDAGKIDGVFDSATGHAVMAFQKVSGLQRTSRATPDVLEALGSAGAPAPLLAAGGGNRVEIDLPRQVLFVYKGGELVRILSISSGNGKKYCVDGECAVAVTPGGSFKANRKIRGVRVSRLGELFNPVYFNGGIAVHGSASVPGYPASHGCVRIPMNSSLWFFDNIPMGTPVYVVGGKKAPVPFGEQAPPADGSSSTTAPPSTDTTAAPTTAPPTTASPTTAAPTSSTTQPPPVTSAPTTTSTTSTTTAP